MSLAPGVHLGAYEIVRLIGAGGMGEVYKAKDTRLDRLVAIKVLPAHFAADPSRRERFEREARAVAALNHPRICRLYDIGEMAPPTSTSPAVGFLVMEYLDGQTLAERLIRGALSLPEALRYAIQIADALNHAHRQGFIHRDLKPGNVMLTGSGAKLLDFGVSKLQPPPSIPALATVSPHDVPLTAEGALLGTFPYLAPEQLEGHEADVRSDIFALGATVYEMATGRRAFQGQATATLIGAILHTDPAPVSALQPLAPPTLDRIVSRCLAKNPNDRWQTSHDLMMALKQIAEHDGPADSSVRRRTKLGVLGSAALALLAIATALVIIRYSRFAAPDDATVRLTFSPPDGLTLADLVIGGPVTISPNGERLAFVATGPDGRQLVWVRSLESPAAQALSGTDGGAYPFWSPDGQSVGFFAQRKLKTVRLSGAAPQTLCDAVLPRGGTWNRDGVIVFSAGAGRQLYRVSARGGTAIPLPADAVNQERHWPSFLPDGRHFVYFGRPQKHAIYVAAIDASNARLLASDHVGVAYASGYLLALRGSSRGAPAGTLLAYPFDPTRVQITGEPTPVAERIRYESGLARGAFTVSENGTLVYGDIDRASTQLIWVDRGGKELVSVGGASGFGQPSLSPDEKTVAVEQVDPITQDQDLWLIDVRRNIPSRFTSQGNNITFMPVWSPDGAKLVFASARGTPPNLYHKASTGAGGDHLLLKSTANTQPTDWSPDGRFIVYATLDQKTQWDLWVIPMSDSQMAGSPTPLLQTEFNEHLGRVSPDGRWLAYASDESGANEIYLHPLPGPGPKRRISVKGGSEPKWRGDGRELFYLASDGRIMAVGVHPGPNLEIGSPAPLFKVRTGPTRNFGYDVNYSVTRDGQRFVIRALAEESASMPTTTVILNWRGNLNLQ